jgi:hypothetical protein
MEFTVVDADGKSLRLKLDEFVVGPDEDDPWENEKDYFDLGREIIEEIRMTKLFPTGTRFFFYFKSEDEDDFDEERSNIGEAFDEVFGFYPDIPDIVWRRNLYVKGYSIEGKAENFLPVPYEEQMQLAYPSPMIKSANKTASARMIKEALVLHRGNVQKAADWVSKRQQKE